MGKLKDTVCEFLQSSTKEVTLTEIQEYALSCGITKATPKNARIIISTTLAELIKDNSVGVTGEKHARNKTYKWIGGVKETYSRPLPDGNNVVS